MAVYSERSWKLLLMYVVENHINSPFLDLPKGQEEEGAIHLIP